MPFVFRLAIISALFVGSLAPALAADPTKDGYNGLDTWERFSDKEQTTGFKLSKPKLQPKHDSVLVPALKPTAQIGDPGQSYVLMPAADPPPVQPQVNIETTLVPTIRQDAPVPYLWGSPGYWNGGAYGRHGLWGRGPGWGGYGFTPFVAPSTVVYRPMTRVTQTGPSKASGNYFNPATPDPTASGNYFASPGGTPKLAPIIQQPGSSKDYWGESGNPLPPELRP